MRASVKQTSIPIPQLVYGYQLDKVTQKEKQLIDDPKEKEVIAAFKAQSDALAAKLKDVPAALAKDRADAQAKLDAAKALGEQLAGKTVRVAQKAGVDGRLFGSVTNHDIAEALTKMGLAVAKSQIRLPNGPLKTVGEHAVAVAPHTDVVVDVTVQVVAQAD